MCSVITLQSGTSLSNAQNAHNSTNSAGAGAGAGAGNSDFGIGGGGESMMLHDVNLMRTEMIGIVLIVCELAAHCPSVNLLGHLRSPHSRPRVLNYSLVYLTLHLYCVMSMCSTAGETVGAAGEHQG